MTIKEYFLKAAELWDNPYRNTFQDKHPHSMSYCVRVNDKNSPDYGICDTIYTLCMMNNEEDRRQVMYDLMDKYRGKSQCGYWWPHTLEGAKSRAAFCREMAVICDKENVS